MASKPHVFADDCRHYVGDKPCIHNRLCAGCGHYAPVGPRVCVIKLGALGDVVRTLCILPSLRRQYPGAHVTWVSKPNGCRMIGSHPLIDRVLTFDPITTMTLAAERFDTVICLDKEAEPCALANALNAGEKLGVLLGDHGKPVPANSQAEDYFALGLSDELKFRHSTRSYPQLVHDALGWADAGEPYSLPLEPAAAERADALLTAQGWSADRPLLGVNVGAGRVFANKMWPREKTLNTIAKLVEAHPRLQVVLLGGPDERDTLSYLDTQLSMRCPSATVIDGGGNLTEPQFTALVDRCDAIFCGDTMAMHVAIARGTRVIALFGPTCEQEIDLFDLGEKLVARVPCAPCYKRACDHHDACLDAVSVDDAVAAVARVMRLAPGDTLSLPVLPSRLAG